MTTDRATQKIAIIAGAGPAGLTAALELLRRSNVKPLVFEADRQVGGISKTVNYRGNRMDLGGHRFFSKSDWVMRWWQDILPVARGEADEKGPVELAYQGQTRRFVSAANAASAFADAAWANAVASTASTGRADAAYCADRVLLIRRRMSRIFHRGRFFDYPLKLNMRTLRNIGIQESLRIGMSYGRTQLSPIAPEVTLEDFFINRFGSRLYRTFFKDYTEKVWGVPCREISAEWGAQRIKGLSVSKALAHALTAPWRNGRQVTQKQLETSLIECFLYPKFGPGQMWEEVSRRVLELGGEVRLRQRIVGLERSGQRVIAVTVRNEADQSIQRLACDHFVSTMPVRELITLLQPDDTQLLHIAQRLPYRDFMTAGLLLRKMTAPVSGGDRAGRIHAATGKSPTGGSNGSGMPPDNWIYVQEPHVKVGRLQVFNNWSPAMVADPDTIWLGLEYFCQAGDALWSMPDGDFIDFAARELETLGMIDRRDLLDGTVVRVPQAYPAYFGGYDRIGELRRYFDGFDNLYPVGRNGMHRYNNQDHSMLAASAAVDAIVGVGAGKSAIWAVNAEDDYHETLRENAEVPTVS